jgi:hypothetical protein
MPPVDCGAGYPITYQRDITLIAGSSMALNHHLSHEPNLPMTATRDVLSMRAAGRWR